MEERRIQAGEYEVVIKWEDDLIEVVVLDALGEEIEGMRVSDDDRNIDNQINLN